jgi:hypothetical protein
MKTAKLPAKEKPAPVGRISCTQTNYSAAALIMMEKAVGHRITQSASPTPATPPVQAVDAD